MQEVNLKTTLINNLKDAKKIAILGVGSELKADDSAGMLIAKNIDKKCKDINSDVFIFFGSTAPENLTGAIKQYLPSHLIIIDAADTGSKPGTITFLDSEKIEGISFSTHMLPIKIMTDYITQSINCKIIIIGIQPKTLEFGQKCSKEVKTAIKKISNIFEDVLLSKSYVSA